MQVRVASECKHAMQFSFQAQPLVIRCGGTDNSTSITYTTRFSAGNWALAVLDHRQQRLQCSRTSHQPLMSHSGLVVQHARAARGWARFSPHQLGERDTVYFTPGTCWIDDEAGGDTASPLVGRHTYPGAVNASFFAGRGAD